MRSSVALVVLCLVACTARNPEFCGDGTCIDPARPFCDVDGTFGVNPGTCIAVECTPGTFAACRTSDVALTCAASGHDYDVMQCPLGCDPDASGCRACTADAQCPTTTPICDATSNSCRGCETDDECESRVCDRGAGTCVAADSILYAAPGAFGTCSLNSPCSISTAVVQATNATVQPIVRMLPGTYTETLDVKLATAQPLQIVATGATIAVGGDTPAITVDKGADVDVRALAVTSGRLAICGSSTSGRSTLSLQDVDVLELGGVGGLFDLTNCTFSLKSSTLRTPDDGAVRDGSTLHVDHVHWAATDSAAGIVLIGSNVTVEVTDSLLEKFAVTSFLSDTVPDSRLLFAYDTIVYDQRLDLCSGATAQHRSVRFENSILDQQRGEFDAVTTPNPANCTFVSTLLSHQSAPLPSGTSVGSLLFVDELGKDFHLTSGSPAVNAATAGTVTSDRDLDGVARPQGPAPDIGAYELKP